MKEKNKKGVTLISLVITIIILIILAGVSISSLIGEEGIIGQANKAKLETRGASVEEERDLWEIKNEESNNPKSLNDLLDELVSKELLTNKEKNEILNSEPHRIIIGSKDIIFTEKTNEGEGGIVTPPTQIVVPGEEVAKTEKNNYIDTAGNKATVPAGFIVVPGCETINEGLVISDNLKDTEKEGIKKQTLGNQFVWIPVSSADIYIRDFTLPSYYDEPLENTPNRSTFTDKGYLPASIQPSLDNENSNEEAERQAVMKYNGFYVGRFEAGREGKDKLVCKKNVPIYNNITQTDSKIKAKELLKNNQYVESAICSGIQWDMVMRFVNGKLDGKNKIYNVRVSDIQRHAHPHTDGPWIDMDGNRADIPSNSGLNDDDKVQNIYDLEGNVSEYIAEKNNTTDSFVYRGGNCNNTR